jgi:Prokaryotic phospholipase A2
MGSPELEVPRMHRRRLTTVLITAAITAVSVLGLAQPAGAVTLDQKLAVMSSWSQTSVSSSNAWAAARNNQAPWAEYAFDWSTDYCSDSPDNPLGFNFSMSCARHDFGYRNYKAVSQFPANKSRLDSAFYEDLKRKCATYNVFVRPACNALAWTYYQAVKAFGSVVVSAADLARAAALLPRTATT